MLWVPHKIRATHWLLPILHNNIARKWLLLLSLFVSLVVYVCRIAGPDREAVDLIPGSQYILRYEPVSSLVKSGAVRLI